MRGNAWMGYAVLGGLLGAFAWALALPWSPRLTLYELKGKPPVEREALREWNAREVPVPAYASGAHDLIAPLILGAVLGGGLILLFERRPSLRTAPLAVVGALAGAGATLATSHLADYVDRAIVRSSGGLLEHAEFGYSVMPFLVGIGLATVVVGAVERKPSALGRAVLLGGVVGAATVAVSRVMASVLLESDMFGILVDGPRLFVPPPNKDLFGPMRIRELLYDVVLGAVLAAGLALLRHQERAPSLAPSGRQWLEGAAGIVPLSLGRQVLGRSEEAGVVRLAGEGVSRRHAQLFAARDGATIEDMGSTNGVRVNGTRIQSAALADGDVVEFGSARFTYRIRPG